MYVFVFSFLFFWFAGVFYELLKEASGKCFWRIWDALI